MMKQHRPYPDTRVIDLLAADGANFNHMKVSLSRAQVLDGGGSIAVRNESCILDSYRPAMISLTA